MGKPKPSMGSAKKAASSVPKEMRHGLPSHSKKEKEKSSTLRALKHIGAPAVAQLRVVKHIKFCSSQQVKVFTMNPTKTYKSSLIPARLG